jgi:hypothetical protein
VNDQEQAHLSSVTRLKSGHSIPVKLRHRSVAAGQKAQYNQGLSVYRQIKLSDKLSFR